MTQRQHGFTRRVVLGAFGALMMVLGVGKSSAQTRRPAGASPAVQEVCVECLAKRARQRTAFINKWV